MFCSERLSRTADGDVIYRLRRKWKDGTVSLRFSPYELIEKLCALVPPPMFNLTRFHGVLAPAHRLRALVVPKPDEDETRAPKQLRLFGTGRQPTYRSDGKPRAEPRPRMPWQQLLKRSFGVDTLVCPECGHRPMKLVAMATRPAAARSLLASLGLSTQVPPTRLPRGPPESQLGLFESPPPPRPTP